MKKIFSLLFAIVFIFLLSSHSALAQNPNSTTFSLVIGLDGIGSTGTHKNPVIPTENIQQPVVKNFPITVALFSGTTLKYHGDGTIDYITDVTNLGKFKTTTPIGFGETVTPGSYTVKLSVPGYEYETALPQAESFDTSASHTLSQAINLMVGDVNNDHIIDVADYTQLVKCDGKKITDDGCKYADLDNNGVVDLTNSGYDYNLFLAEYSTQFGDSGDSGTKITTPTTPTASTLGTAATCPTTTSSSVKMSWATGANTTETLLYYCDKTKAADHNVSCTRDSQATNETIQAGWYFAVQNSAVSSPQNITGLTSGDQYTAFVRASNGDHTNTSNPFTDSNNVDFTAPTCSTTTNLDSPMHIAFDFYPQDLSKINDVNLWKNEINSAYNAYQDLTGITPYNGQVITYKEAPAASLNGGSAACLSGNPIQCSDSGLPAIIKSVNDYYNVGFGQLHELGHDFGWNTQVYPYLDGDLDAINDENWANFKVTYVADTIYTKYPGISLSEDGKPNPLQNLGKGYFVPFANQWLGGNRDWTKMRADNYTGLLYTLVQTYGWDPFKKTFHDYASFQSQNKAVPSSDLAKLQLFADTLSANAPAGNDIKAQYRSWGIPIN